ncbi:MIT C-terminal domain-containing protein [Sphingobium yanoikuyae]|uniref:MIT C-terminal domain-containing protein n=3 Tax=Sphingobium TaxID=165695 RepID=UPI00207BABAF|nr:MIT C-terminal domain-containing protein [Sphingobium yanoikuyae]
MSNTPYTLACQSQGRVQHGSILSGNLCPTRVTSQWKSTDSIRPEKQAENLGAIAQSCEGIGISFTWEFDQTNTIHARHIVTDTGWKIALDRGLDIFQQYELNDAFSFANRLQQFRSVKAFEVIYLRTSKAD